MPLLPSVVTRFLVAASLGALAGCAPALRLSVSPASWSVAVTPRFVPDGGAPAGQRRLQAPVAAYSAGAIHHLTLKVYRVVSGVETEIAAPEFPGGTDWSKRLVIDHLEPDTAYRLRAFAYKAAGDAGADLISAPTTSKLDFSTTSDDAITVGALTVYMIPVPFSATAGPAPFAITPGGVRTGLRGIISTIAGPPGSLRNGPAADALFYFPMDAAHDPGTGATYVADMYNNVIRRIQGGAVSILAGSGQYGSTDAWGLAARFNNPRGLALDAGGPTPYLYVADSANNRIRRIDLATTEVVTIAGGSGGFADGSGPPPLTAARFRTPLGLEFVPPNFLYVADAGNNVVRRIALPTGGSPNVTVTTVAGDGTAGFAEGVGAAARFNYPQGVAYLNAAPDPATGALYVGDYSNLRLRRIDLATGAVTSVAGTGASGTVVGPTGVSRLGILGDVCAGSDGRIYVLDSSNNCVRVYDPATTVLDVLAGSGTPAGLLDGAASVARLNAPRGIAAGPAGTILVADTYSNALRTIAMADGAVATLAGGAPFGAGDGTGKDIQLRAPSGLAFDAAGNLYVSERFGHAIRKLTRAGQSWTSTLLCGSAAAQPGFADSATPTSVRFNNPRGLAVGPDGALYVADGNNRRVRRVDPATGATTTVAGSGANGAADDAVATSATFGLLTDLCFAPDGTAYVADAGNHLIRQLGPGGVSTVAGTAGVAGFANGVGTAVRFDDPLGVRRDPATGDLIVVENDGALIRRLHWNGSGWAASVAGGVPGGTGRADGPAGQGTLTSPEAGAIGPDGAYYFIDGSSGSSAYVRRLDLASGTLSTVLKPNAYLDEGPTFGRIGECHGIAFGPDGLLYLADFNAHRLRCIE